jgi:exosortase
MTSSPSSSPARPNGASWLSSPADWAPPALFAGWWLHNLRFHWSEQAEFNFGYIVAMLVGFLVWDRWPRRPLDDVPAAAWKSWGLVLLGFPLVLFSELYRHALVRTPSSAMALSLGTTCFVAGYILARHGPKTLRHFLFPILFAFVSVPIPNLVWKPIVVGLQGMVSFFDVELLNLGGIPAVREGSIIRLPRCRVGVDEACSGIRSLQSSVMVALFIGDQTLRRIGWKVFFLVAGVALAILGNIGRSLYLSLTAHWHGPEALKAVHDSAGWSVLVFTFVGLAGLAWLAGRLEAAASRHAVEVGASADVGDDGSADPE